MADACECGNEPSGSVKCGEFLYKCWRHAAAVWVCMVGSDLYEWKKIMTLQTEVSLVSHRYCTIKHGHSGSVTVSRILIMIRRVRNEKLHKRIQSFPCVGLSVYRLYQLGKH